MTFVILFALTTLVISSNSLPFTGGRIIGGGDTLGSQAPYMAAVHDANTDDHLNTFAAVIISPRYLLTAAHRIIGKQSSAITVSVGLTERKGKLPSELAIKRYIIHEKYRDFHNNIALIELVEPIQFVETIKIQPIALGLTHILNGVKAFAVGFNKYEVSKTMIN